MAVSDVIWDQWLPAAIKIALQKDLSLNERDSRQLVKLICGMHDLGKAAPDFSGRSNVQYQAGQQHEQMVSYGFRFASIFAARGVGEREKLRHEQLSAAFLKPRWADVLGEDEVRNLLAPLALHHGHSHEEGAVFNKRTRVENVLQQDLTWTRALDNTYELVLARLNASFDSANPLGFPATLEDVPLRAQILIGGLLRMADWLASTPELLALIPMERVPQPEDLGFLESRYAQLDAASLGLAPQFVREAPENIEAAFADFGFLPNEAQEALYESVSAGEADNLYLLEAPMGYGKTEAALVAAQVLAAKSGRSGFFFGLPTRATADAVFNRVNGYLQARGGSPTTLALHHGTAAFSEAYQRARITPRSKFSAGHLLDEGWLHSSNRRILNEHVVGTIDAFLMLSLKHKSAYWKHLGLASKVVILDEVHAADEYMMAYLCRSLTWAGFYGTPVIMLSATLSERQRSAYLKAYAEGKALR